MLLVIHLLIGGFWVFSSQIRNHANILAAVTLQDMKTRYGASYGSYLIAVAWPLVHAAFIIVGYMIVNKVAPLGEDPIAFVATGVIPFMICLYPSRLIGLTLLNNKPFLSYAIVQPIHLILARCILEFLNSAIVVIFLLIACFALDREIIPIHLDDAGMALGASLLFGIGFGIFTAIFTAILGIFFSLISGIIVVFLYIGSLTYLPRHFIGSDLLKYLVYNPVFTLVNWARTAYFESYDCEYEQKIYVIQLSIVFLFFGLLGERLLRGRMLGN